MQDTKTLTLRKPISLKGDKDGASTVHQLELREPTVDELDRCLRTEGSLYAQNAALISMVAGVPEPIIRQMGKIDYEEATVFLAGFIWHRPVSGETEAIELPTLRGSIGGDPTQSAA